MPPSLNDAWSVEAAVAQHDCFEPVGVEHCGFEVTDRRQRLLETLWRVRVERVSLGLDRSSPAGEGPPGVALGDEASDAGGADGSEQVVGAR